MLKIRKFLKENNLIPKKYIKNKKTTMVVTDKCTYVFKKYNGNNIYEYLESKDFKNFPKAKFYDDYIVYEYIEDSSISCEQKIYDLIEIVSILHSKTAYYEEIDNDEYEKLYQDLTNNIEYLYNYYNDLMTIIESKVYMSPPEYLLSLNIQTIYKSLSMANYLLQKWHNIINDLKKKRLVVIHNNLDTSHFILGNNPYLISFDKSKIDMPIFDLYKLYKKATCNFSYDELLKKYEKVFKLEDYERILLFILLLLPDELKWDSNNIDMCIIISRNITFTNKVINLVLPYYFKDSKNN